jgi:hypothetical protein
MRADTSICDQCRDRDDNTSVGPTVRRGWDFVRQFAANAEPLPMARAAPIAAAEITGVWLSRPS